MRLARWTAALGAALLLAPAAASAQGAPAASVAPFGTSAVLLVGGFDSSSPFSTPACAATDRGPTWGVANGPASALSAAGVPVFTAPIANAGQEAAPSCLGGRATPDIPHDGSLTIDSNGAMPANQQALVSFLAFLNRSYGITSVQLVGHSDGGLWSRAAIDQLRRSGSPLAITNLTTIGTPHLGSFGADIAVAIESDGGKCADLPRTERIVCQLISAAVLALIEDLGRDVIEELSSGWLSQWNRFTTIGCPVTTLAGDHVGWSIGLGYYTPNDGIVGEASALNQATLFPALRPAPFTPTHPPGFDPPTFDVVHSPVLSFLSPHNELNTLRVSQAVLAAVQHPPASACVHTGDQPRGLQRHRAAPRRLRVSLPMRARHAVRNGTLPRLRARDAILLRRRGSVRCRGRKLPAAPLLGSKRARIVVARCRHRVRVRGRALHLDRVRTSVELRRHGRTLRWRVTHGRLRHVRTQLRIDGRWRTLKRSRITVPRAAREPALRVRGVDRAGRTVRAFTRLAV